MEIPPKWQPREDSAQSALPGGPRGHICVAFALYCSIILDGCSVIALTWFLHNK